MDIDPKVELVRRLCDEVYNAGQFERAAEFLAANLEYQGPSASTSSRDEFIQLVEAVRHAWQNFTVTVDRISTTAHTVTIEFAMAGIHAKEFWGVPPTHQPFTVKGKMTIRVRNEMIVSIDTAYDVNSLLRQLGVVRTDVKSRTTNREAHLI